jgi:hypothetical protein
MLVLGLEHVLPVNPGTNWPNMSPDLAAALYTRLGNLAMLQVSKNSDLANKSFAEKKKVLGASAYKLTSQIAAYADWGLNEMNDRQVKLAELAVKTWTLDVK